MSRVIDLASKAVSDLWMEGDVMGDVGLCAGCEMDLSRLAELAWRGYEMEEEDPELDRTLCRLVWLPPPLGGGRMVSVVADSDRIGFGCSVEPDAFVWAEALSRDADSEEDELEDDDRAVDSLSCASSSIGSGGSGALYILGEPISLLFKSGINCGRGRGRKKVKSNCHLIDWPSRLGKESTGKCNHFLFY